ncbi:MAG: zinc-ribbon domain-containing protein [Deltaproteobacteria bacterium]|nr:zinc-ribbon domain-containing protein [Deltaproteobacteria bacterium]
MRIACPSCKASYNVDDRRIPAAGLNVRCPKCQAAFPVRPAVPVATGPTPVPLPTAARAPAPRAEEPLGGHTATFDSPFAAGPVATPPPPGEHAAAFAQPPFPEAAGADPLGGATMRFATPFGEEKPAPTPPFGTVPLPQPDAAAFAEPPDTDPIRPPPPPAPPPLPAKPPDAQRPVPLPPAPPVEDQAPPFGSSSGQEPFAAPLGFGEVDLGTPPPSANEDPLPVPADPDPPSVPPPADPFPSAAARTEGEELEALFGEGAPPPPPPARAQPERAAESGAAWRVRRRSGKVFGPFPEGEVVDMLVRGELLGNEEVAGEGRDEWRSIGTVPAFDAAIRRLIEGPPAGAAPSGRTVPVVAAEPAGDHGPPAPRGPGLADRLATLRVRLDAGLSRLPRWGRIAIPAALVLVLVGGGLSVGLTDYGVFFHRLIRGQVGPNRPGARLCAQARSRLAEDGFPGAQAALELASRAVSLSAVDREAKGLQVQVTGWMARRTGVAPEVLAQAQQLLPELMQQAPQQADTLKAQVSMALATGQPPPPAALGQLERWLAKAPKDDDALFLLAEVALARKETGRAEGLLQRLAQQQPGPRAPHALGLAALQRGDSAAATGHFKKALEAGPAHLSSSLELAALALAAGDLAAAQARLEPALTAEGKAQLGPRERARARQLHGELLARQVAGPEAEGRLAAAEKELEEAVQEDPAYAPARASLTRFLLRRNAPDRALAALQPALASGDAEISDLHARALAGTGRVLDAVNALDAAVAKWGKSPRLTYARGLVMAQGGKRAEAEKLFAEAAADPGYWEPHLALGRSRLAAGDVEGAAPALGLAAEKAPGEPDAQAGLGDLRLARGDAEGARRAYEKALALDPTHAPSHLGVAREALARGDAAAARGALERAVRFDPRLTEARVLFGTLRWREGDLPGAAEEFRAAVAADPRQALARTRLGAVQLEQGKVEAAYVDLLAASNVEVALAENRYWLGRALLEKGDAVPAAEQLTRAFDLDKKNGLYPLWLGVAYEKAGKPAEAQAAYRAALSIDPRLVAAAEKLGVLLAGQQACPEAVGWFEKAIQVAPREQRLRILLADCRLKMGEAPRAIQIYKDALKADPGMVALYYRIARAVHESSGPQQALPWYEKAATLDKDNPMPHYYLGFAFKVKGQRQKAVQAFKSYLRLKPDAEDRRDIEQEIEYMGGQP